MKRKSAWNRASCLTLWRNMQWGGNQSPGVHPHTHLFLVCALWHQLCQTLVYVEQTPLLCKSVNWPWVANSSWSCCLKNLFHPLLFQDTFALISICILGCYHSDTARAEYDGIIDSSRLLFSSCVPFVHWIQASECTSVSWSGTSHKSQLL